MSSLAGSLPGLRRKHESRPRLRLRAPRIQPRGAGLFHEPRGQRTRAESVRKVGGACEDHLPGVGQEGRDLLAPVGWSDRIEPAGEDQDRHRHAERRRRVRRRIGVRPFAAGAQSGEGPGGSEEGAFAETLDGGGVQGQNV